MAMAKGAGAIRGEIRWEFNSDSNDPNGSDQEMDMKRARHRRPPRRQRKDAAEVREGSGGRKGNRRVMPGLGADSTRSESRGRAASRGIVRRDGSGHV